MSGRVYVNANTVKLIRASLYTKKKELAGELVPSRGHGLVARNMRYGKYDSVQVPRGVVDFHTHPVVCKNQNKCALEVPSAFDIAFLFENQAQGRNQYHFLFTRMGTYRIRLKRRAREAYRQSAAADASFPAQFRAMILKLFGDMHEKFNEAYPAPGFTLHKFRARWLRRMREFGIQVKLFTHPSRLWIPALARDEWK